MTKPVYLVLVLYLSLGTLIPHSVIAQIEGSETNSHPQVEQPSPTSPEESSPPKKATLSTDPEDISRILQIGGRVNLAKTEIVNDIILIAGDAKIQGRVKGYAGKVTVVL